MMLTCAFTLLAICTIEDYRLGSINIPSVIITLYIIQDEEKAADEMAKRRAAFLLKQQRKAEETRLRKQQHEAESELKRDEARYGFRFTS